MTQHNTATGYWAFSAWMKEYLIETRWRRSGGGFNQ